MRQYFEEQLKNAMPLTEESIECLKQGRIASGASTDSLSHLVPGDILLFVLVNHYDEGNCRIEKILEREIEAFCDKHTFLEMAGTNSSVPRFEVKK